MEDTIPTTHNPTLGIAGEEAPLADHLRRILNNRRGCIAVHIHLSRLRPYHREPTHVRIAVRAFEYLSNNYDANLYVAANCDLVLMCRDVRVNDIDVAIRKLRNLFAEDPLIFGDDGGRGERFASWYDLEADHEVFSRVLDALIAEGRRITENKESRGAAAELGKPMDARSLAAVVDRLHHTRIADLVSQQAAVEVSGPGDGRILFREHFVSIADLKKRVAPGVHLLSDFWLFQCLTETLDRRMLAVHGRRDLATASRPVSLNLNISTVLSADFDAFAMRIGDKADKVVVELQQIDVFADLALFRRARDRLRRDGFAVLVDGVNPLGMQYFDPLMLGADYIKVNWSGNLLSSEFKGRLRRMRDAVADIRDTIVLARIDHEDAIRVGMEIGVTRFQGRFIDRLVSAMAADGPA